MIRIATIARSAAAALALALTVAPLTASADEPTPKQERHQKGAHERAAFPMKAEEFEALVEKRIADAHAHMERAIVDRGVPDLVAAAVRRDFEAGAAQVRAATKVAEKNGVVTHEEARAVRKLARTIANDLKEKYGVGRGEHAKNQRGQRRGRAHSKAA